MYNNADIAAIHQHIKKSYNHGLVLLGGSYGYGEETADSDVDFYLIAPLGWILYYRFTKSKKIAHKKYPGVNLILIPQSFYRRGWYYVYGKDDRGRIHCTPINRLIIFRNSLKLAYFNYLKFLLADQSQKPYLLTKAIKCGITARAMLGNAPSGPPLLSNDFMAAWLQLNPTDDWSVFANLLKKGVTDPPELDALEEVFLKLTRALYLAHPDALRFSLVNYLTYNAKFWLWQGKAIFLFRNPDKFILRKLEAGLASGIAPDQLYQQVAPIIFPIVIL